MNTKHIETFTERLQRYRSAVTHNRGLTAWEWDNYDDIEKQLEPHAFRDRWTKARKESMLKDAQELSIEELEVLIAKKQAEPTVEQTIEFIKKAHAGQTDRGGKPYWMHPVSVMRRLSPYVPYRTRLVALLHDVLEDTTYTAAQLLELGYPPTVISAVELLSRPTGPDSPDYLTWIRSIARSHNHAAIAVKIADNEDNMDPARMAALPSDDPALAKHVAQYEQSLRILRGTL